MAPESPSLPLHLRHPVDVVKARTRMPKQAAKLSVDPNRLLPGEPKESEQVQEIQHWIAVYKDLLGIKRVMITAAERQIAKASEAARKEFRRTDATILAAERRRVERRLAFWRRHLRAVKA